MKESSSLLHLSDDVICVLLQYLDATSLFQLGRTCRRLSDIINNHRTIWKNVDARRNPNSYQKLIFCLNHCYDGEKSGTTSFLCRGENQEDVLLLANIFAKFNSLLHLSILACENQTIDGSKYNVMSFPSQLHELSLKRTVIRNSLEFFRGSGDHFQKLRVLLLDECNWLMTSAFMPISKYKNLEIFSVYKCNNLENSVPYLSLAGHGFKNLKIFDARLSSLGNTLISCIYPLQSLLALYFQNNDVTYKIDYFKRKLEIMKGTQVKNFYNENEFGGDSDDETNEETQTVLSDHGLLDYLSVRSATNMTKIPKSVLYCHPYSPCTCGYSENKTIESDDSDETRTFSEKIVSLTESLRSHPSRRKRPRQDWENFQPPFKKRRIDGPSTSSQTSGSGSDSEAPLIVVSIFAMNGPAMNRNPPRIRIENVVDAHRDVTVPLKQLSLRGFKKITNTALRYLHDLELDILDVTYTSVTQDGIEEFLKSHPLCRILHENFCRCLPNLHF